MQFQEFGPIEPDVPVGDDDDAEVVETFMPLVDGAQPSVGL